MIITDLNNSDINKRFTTDGREIIKYLKLLPYPDTKPQQYRWLTGGGVTCEALDIALCKDFNMSLLFDVLDYIKSKGVWVGIGFMYNSVTIKEEGYSDVSQYNTFKESVFFAITKYIAYKNEHE